MLTRLVDDAAVFPPASLPVAQAWSEHLRLRAGWYGDLLGPLLIPVSAAAELVEAAESTPRAEDLETGTGHGPRPVEVGLIARAGVSIADLLYAVGTVVDAPELELAAVEVAYDPNGEWRAAIDLEAPLAVEVGRDPWTRNRALDDLVSEERERLLPVVAKFRTQSTPTTPVPTARELAEFLSATLERGLAFKLTGGLHHAVVGEVPRAGQAGPDGATEVQHGLLNVVLATHYLSQGSGLSLSALEAVLTTEDAQGLAALVRELGEAEVAAVRARFVSFGCCTVTDPLDELTALGLL